MRFDGLTFESLRMANLSRLPELKNRKGEPAHTVADGSDWSLTDWMTAVTGEVGEAANIIKKVRRGDMTLDEARIALADELADVAIYLDILAYRAGINLGKAIESKWNETSRRVDSGWRIDSAGDVYNTGCALPDTQPDGTYLTRDDL